MDINVKHAYVYQPMPPREDGKFYGVGGLGAFGLTEEEANIKGIDKSTAQEISKICNESPEFAASFIRSIRKVLWNQ